MKILLPIFVLLSSACSFKTVRPQENRVSINFKAPENKCEFKASQTIQKKIYKTSEEGELDNSVVTEMIRLSSEKNANYVEIIKQEDFLLRKGSRAISSLNENQNAKDYYRVKLETKYYSCP